MTAPLRVLLLPADEGACGLYRMISPARAVAAATNDVELYVAKGLVGRQTRDAQGVVTTNYLEPINADVVVYQRPMFDALVSTIPLVQAQGITVVVELDDDIVGVPSHNQAYQIVHPMFNLQTNWKHLQRACAMADWMTCTTPALGERYMPGRYTVVPNYVPRSLTAMARPDHGSLVTLGWTGTLAVHAQDLQSVGSAVAQVIQQTSCNFLVVGESRGVGAALGLHADPPETGWIPLPYYPDNLVKLDVGIVPLEPNSFNQAKSWLKGMEMAAVGVPFVASPTAEYLRLNELGIGIIAHRRKDWLSALTRLVADVEYRTELAGCGRELVRQRLTIEGNVEQWIAAWHTARRRTLHGTAETASGS